MADVLPLATPVFERRVLREHVYDAVLEMLMASGITPGSRLSIEEIARELRVSPTPVREALAQLERTGMVTREAHKGYRVAEELDDTQVSALFDARVVLEGSVVEFAAKANPRLAEDLRPAHHAHSVATQELVALSKAGDGLAMDALKRYFEADWGFHEAIFASTSNSFLFDMSTALSTRIHPMRRVIASGVSDAEIAVAEHQMILDAMAEGPVEAADAMRRHIRNVQERYVDSLGGDRSPSRD